MKEILHFVALVICVSRLMLPLVVAPALRATHTHSVIGMVTAEEMESHVESELDDGPPVKAQPTLRGGIIMNLPFGDWQSLVQITLVALAIESLLIVPTYEVTLRRLFLKPYELFLPKNHPPPRRVRMLSECLQVG